MSTRITIATSSPFPPWAPDKHPHFHIWQDCYDASGGVHLEMPTADVYLPVEVWNAIVAAGPRKPEAEPFPFESIDAKPEWASHLVVYPYGQVFWDGMRIGQIVRRDEAYHVEDKQHLGFGSQREALEYLIGDRA